MYSLPTLLSQYRAEGRLQRHLVLELGTNGPFDEDQLLSTLQSLGSSERIVLVNANEPRPWQDDVNRALADVAHRMHNVTIADWYSASAGHSEYFWDDAVHPDGDGSQVMATLIARAVGPAQPANAGAPNAHLVGCPAQ